MADNIAELVNSKVIDALEKAADTIKANMEAEGINASGRTSGSIHVEVYEGGARIVQGGQNTAPLSTLETGRPGGKVPAGFTDILKQWSIDKGISFADEDERSAFAYFLARRIAREGTLRSSSPKDIYTSTVQKCANDIAYIITDSIKSIITK